MLADLAIVKTNATPYRARRSLKAGALHPPHRVVLALHLQGLVPHPLRALAPQGPLQRQRRLVLLHGDAQGLAPERDRPDPLLLPPRRLQAHGARRPLAQRLLPPRRCQSGRAALLLLARWPRAAAPPPTLVGTGFVVYLPPAEEESVARDCTRSQEIAARLRRDCTRVVRLHELARLHEIAARSHEIAARVQRDCARYDACYFFF